MRPCKLPCFRLRYWINNRQWDDVSEGASSAYFGTCVSGFPNFFVMMGPNTLSGHLSVIYTTECQINFTMRVISPVMKALRNSRSILPTICIAPDIIEVKADAEQRDIATVQEKAKELVWATGCTSWFIEATTGRNTIMYPDWQYRFWLRSIFIAWNDLAYRKSKHAVVAGKQGVGASTLVVLTSVIFGAGALFFGRAV